MFYPQVNHMHTTLTHSHTHPYTHTLAHTLTHTPPSHTHHPCMHPHTAETESEKEIGLEISVDDNVMIGQDFFVRATVTNKTSRAREFQLTLNGHAVLYTGSPGQLVKSLEERFKLKGRESEFVKVGLCNL